jgi:hypothetical protein
MHTIKINTIIIFVLFLNFQVFSQERESQYPVKITNNAHKILRGLEEIKPNPTANQTTLSAGNSFNVSSAPAEAARSNSLQDIPVNQYTGSAGINIPLTQLSQGRLGIGLSLNYNHSLVQTHNVATWCGLGWDLAGIPTISRIVKDKPDEGYMVNYVGKKGYYWYGPGINNADLERDKEADIFVLNTASGSYKFILNIRGNAVFFPVSDIRLSVSLVDNPLEQGTAHNAKIFNQFTVNMPDGTNYYFYDGYTEKSMEIEVNDLKSKIWYSGSSDYNSYHANNSQVSAWYCSRIDSPYFEAISLLYENTFSSYFKLAESQATNMVGCPTNASKKINRVFAEGLMIKEIKSADLKISFNKVLNPYQRDDIATYGFPNTSAFSYQDGLPAKRLGNIVISDNEINPSTFSTIQFDYGYFNAASFGLPTGYSYTDLGLSHEKRLKLSKITLPDASTYTFQYLAENTTHQSRLSYGVDHWGFANGKETNLGSYGLIGQDALNTCGSDRAAVYAESVKGMLYKITHSSGSETEITYEPHSANNTNMAIGGARVRDVTNRDLIRNIENKKRYTYETSPGVSSGYMFLKPMYTIQYNAIKEANSSLFQQLLGESGRPVVGYSRVREEIFNTDPALQTGHAISYFNQTEIEGSIRQNISNNYVPVFFNLKNDYLQGALLKTETYNSLGTLLSKTELTYSPLNEIVYASFYQSKLFQFSNGTTLVQDYADDLTHFRPKSTIITSYGRTGTGTPSVQTTSLTYKNEMPSAYLFVYPGLHQNVVKTSTIDEEGVLIENYSKIAADYNFTGSSITYCDIECITPTQCDTITCYTIPQAVQPPYGNDANGIYAALSLGMKYLPIETITKRNGQTVAATYQSYRSDNSGLRALPLNSYSLKIVPKLGFQEASYNNTSQVFSKDPDYGPAIATVLDYNIKGMPLRSKPTYGPETNFGYATNGLIGLIQNTNVLSNSLTQSQTYTNNFRGPSEITSANGLKQKYSYGNFDGRLIEVKDKDNNYLQTYAYQSSPQIPNLSLVFDNTLRTKLCTGAGNITIKVYVTGLLPLTSAEFSLDAGNTWLPANIGSSGFSFNTTETNTYVAIQARAVGNTATILNTTYHASCSTIPPTNWGATSVQANGSNTCKYSLAVQGLKLDSYAEFSLDQVNWYKATIGSNGFQFVLLQGSAGSSQAFYFRPAENPSYTKQININTCTN